ncbi:unnamed protein product [Bursaphelenchus xylophilus]|nr:unnamed protein product [Bursaphelenchus xylophilus]CAG9094739.1 unnamed protein product [Bursaphelenchus xylophilus]
MSTLSHQKLHPAEKTNRVEAKTSLIILSVCRENNGGSSRLGIAHHRFATAAEAGDLSHDSGLKFPLLPHNFTLSMFKTPTLLLLLLQIHCAFSANVLFFLHGTNQFDRHVFEFLAQQIALRHHNVITVKPILIPEEPRLVKPRLHLVKEKIVKNLLPQELYGPIERVGSSVPWERNYQLDAYNHPYWAGYNASCYKLINSNLMDTLKKEQIEVALVYSGNPCQLAMVHALSIPFIYYDLDGLTDETIIASGMPWNLKTLSSRSVPETKFSELSTGLALIYETVCQLGLPVVGGALCERVRLLEDPITRIFREDYEIKKRFKPFPHVNWRTESRRQTGGSAGDLAAIGGKEERWCHSLTSSVGEIDEEDLIAGDQAIFQVYSRSLEIKQFSSQLKIAGDQESFKWIQDRW